MRKWLVRGLVFSGLGGLVALGLIYQAWTNPEAVRCLVLEKLGVRFVNVHVSVESAHLRLLGGIVVHDLRIGRSDHLENSSFLYVPFAIIFHDKEHMLGGRMAVRQVLLTRPELRLTRGRDGSLNLKGILGPVDLHERMPTVVIEHGTILVEDPALTPTGPLLEIKDVNLTLVNDPLPTLTVEGTGQTDVFGPIKFSATVQRATMAVRADIELTEVSVGPDLIQRLAAACPETATHLRLLRGTGSVAAHLAYYPGEDRPLHYELNAKLSKGTLTHARLSQTLTNLEAEARCVDGTVRSAKLTAKYGPGRITVSLKDLDAAAGESAASFEEWVGALDVKVEDVPITPAVLAKLPSELAWVEKDYAPRGPATIALALRRAGPGQRAQRRWTITAEGMSCVCSYFPYPVDHVHGTIEVLMATGEEREIALDLRGKAGRTPVRVSGTVKGALATSALNIDVRGQGLVLDDKVFNALQALGKDTAKFAAQFLPAESRRLGLRDRPMGKADFHAALRRRGGQRRSEHVFRIDFRESAVYYDLFPYPLENVSGTLVLYPDHWECQRFRGQHAGGEIFVEGRSYGLPPPPPGIRPAEGRAVGRGQPERVHIVIRGRGIQLDKEFGQALAPPGLPDRQALFSAYRTLSLMGRMNFTAEVIDHPGQPQDIDVGVEIQGCTMKPTFFDYALTQVSGSVRYAHNCVYLTDLQARHGQAVLGLTSGLLQLKPGGGFLAWLHNIRAKDLVPDEDFLSALPETLRKGLGPLELTGKLDVDTKLTLDAAPGQGPLKVWWDGGAVMREASFKAGVEMTGVQGQIACHGHHDGREMRGLTGGLLLRQAKVLGQPLTNVSGRLEVWPGSPEVLRLFDLKADLYGGALTGQARLDAGAVLRYDVKLDAVGVKLEEFGRTNRLASPGSSSPQAQLQGPVRASLHLMGEGKDLLGLKGNGRIDVYNGKMGQLPLLLDLVKAFGLRLPDRTAFEQAHVMFAIEGPQVRVDQLDLSGNAISLRGSGTVDLDGSNLSLDFTTMPGRFGDLLPGAMSNVPQAISQQLFVIKARGKLGRDKKGESGVRFEKELVPSVTRPIKRVIGN